MPSTTMTTTMKQTTTTTAKPTTVPELTTAPNPMTSEPTTAGILETTSTETTTVYPTTIPSTTMTTAMEHTTMTTAKPTTIPMVTTTPDPTTSEPTFTTTGDLDTLSTETSVDPTTIPSATAPNLTTFETTTTGDIETLSTETLTANPTTAAAETQTSLLTSTHSPTAPLTSSMSTTTEDVQVTTETVKHTTGDFLTVTAHTTKATEISTEEPKPRTTLGSPTKPSPTSKPTVHQTQSSFVTAERPPTFFFEVTMVNIEFTAELNNPASDEFTSLASQLTETIWSYLQESSLAADIVSVVITRFRQGSVIADYEVHLRQHTDMTDQQVREVFYSALTNSTSRNNSLGIQVETLCMKDDGASTCTGGRGSPKWPSWAVYVIAGGAAAAVFLALVLTVCLVLRRKSHRKEYDCQSEMSEKEMEMELEFDPYGRFNKRGSYFRSVVNPLYDETNSSSAYEFQEILNNISNEKVHQDVNH